jgi:hypothetical protein
LTDADKRRARIGRLAEELRGKCTVDDQGARARCIAIALELVELFRAEEVYSRHPVLDRAKQAIQQVRQQRKAAKEDLEVMALERTMLRTTLDQLSEICALIKEREWNRSARTRRRNPA